MMLRSVVLLSLVLCAVFGTEIGNPLEVCLCCENAIFIGNEHASWLKCQGKGRGLYEQQTETAGWRYRDLVILHKEQSVVHYVGNWRCNRNMLVLCVIRKFMLQLVYDVGIRIDRVLAAAICMFWMPYLVGCHHSAESAHANIAGSQRVLIPMTCPAIWLMLIVTLPNKPLCFCVFGHLLC